MRDTSTDYYRTLLSTASVLPDWQPHVDAAIKRIKKGLCEYMGYDLDWRYVGLLHEMESACDWSCQILNGQHWNKKTTIVPVGFGPWATWKESTRFALQFPGASIAGVVKSLRDVQHPADGLVAIEKWNGLGYAVRGVNSPYLWSGSQHGLGVGKYVADGKYDPAAVSKQVGAAVILKGLLD